MNIAEFLTLSSSICPDRPAIVFESQRYSFAQINERVNRLANALKTRGVSKGDRVALIQVNCHQCVETYFAVAKLGAIYLPLNFRAKAEELEYMLNFAEANTVLVGSRLASYKRPRSVIFVEDIPRNSLGKVIKKDLREKYGKKLCQEKERAQSNYVQT